MNRRRQLNSLHARMARQAASAPAAVDHSTIERLSIADLNYLAPRLAARASSDAISEADFYGPGEADYEPEPDPSETSSDEQEDDDE